MFQKMFLTASLLLASGAALTADAQDKIYLKNGSTLTVKVQEVAPRTVTYKKWDNLTGPDFIVNRNEVDRITFQNGDSDDSEDREEDRPRRNHKMNWGGRPSNVQYGRNILSLAPIQMTNESAAGFGLQYERVLDKRGIFSLYLPLAFSLVRNNNNYYNNYPYTNSNETHLFFNAYPGLKIYPTGSNGVVRYAVGPSLAIGAGTKYYRDQFGTLISDDVFRTGILINNSLNIQPNKNLYLGLELGLGFLYSSTEDNYYYNNNVTDEPLVQFNFKIGYRF